MDTRKQPLPRAKVLIVIYGDKFIEAFSSDRNVDLYFHHAPETATSDKAEILAEQLIEKSSVACWDSSVMVLARDLVGRLEHIEKTLGARYCWESLADGGICGREWARVLGRVDSWIRHAEKHLAENGGDRSAHQLVWGDCVEFLELQEKIENWKNWGV